MKRSCTLLLAAALAVTTLASVRTRPDVADAAPPQKFCVSGLSNNVSYEWKIDDPGGINVADKVVAGFVSSGQEFIDSSNFAAAFVTSIKNLPVLNAFRSGATFDPCFTVTWSGGAFHFFVRTPAGAWCDVSIAGPAGCPFNPTIVQTTGSVGGVSEAPDLGASPGTVSGSSGADYVWYQTAAGIVAGVVVILGAATWYLRHKRHS